MSVSGARPYGQFVVVLLAVAAVSCCGDNCKRPCPVKSPGDKYVLDVEDQTLLLRIAQTWTGSADDGDYEERQGNRCCHLWTNRVAPACSEQVDEFFAELDDKSVDPDRCRDSATTACWADTLVWFQENVPVCKPMELHGMQTVWPWEGDKLEACPRVK